MSDAPLHVGDQLEAIFADRRFVVWRWETRQGARTKVPYEPGSGRKAESDNPATWRTYQEACATLAKGNVDGIGYCLMARDGLRRARPRPLPQSDERRNRAVGERARHAAAVLHGDHAIG